MAVVEVVHDAFEFAFAHLSVCDGDAGVGQGVGDEARDAFDAVYVVVQEEDLSATVHFAFAGFFDDGKVPRAEDGLYALPSGGRGGDDGEVAQAGKRKVEGARDGGGGEGQEVDVGAQFFQLFFLPDAEALFFVDDDESEVFELHIFL